MKTINRIIQFLKGKNVYLQDFDKKVKGICLKENQSYYSVEITLTTGLKCDYRDNEDKKVNYRCYINGFDWCSGESVKESIEDLEKNIISKKNINNTKSQVENIII